MHGFTLLPERGVLAVGGQDRLSFLNNLVSNEVSAIAPCYTLLLSPQGKFLHDFFIIPTPDNLLIDCEAPRRADLLQRLTRYKLRSAVVVQDVTSDYAVVACHPAIPLVAPAAQVFTDPRHSQLGQRIVVASDWLPDLKARCLAAGLSECEAADYTRHRLALGIPDGSRDAEVERAFPMDYGFDKLNAISFTKGCYIGQELTARMKHRGLVKKQLCRVALEGPLPAPGTPIMAGTQEAGELRSGIDHTALALLRTEFLTQPLTCTEIPVKLLP